jgi:alcohol dehydrogenase class IV
MTDMTFRLDPEIILGTDTISRIGACAANLGNKALIIAEQGPFAGGLLDRISALLEDAGVDAIQSDTIPLIAAADVAEAAGELARGSRCSLIIAVGSPVVQALARTAAVIGPSRESIYDFLDGNPPDGPFLPYIAVPTTGSDPFLLSPRFILTDPRDRLVKLMLAPPGICRAVFWDSRIIGASPEKYPAAAAFDGFLAALEAWCSTRTNAVAEALLEKALIRFARPWRPWLSEPAAAGGSPGNDAGSGSTGDDGSPGQPDTGVFDAAAFGDASSDASGDRGADGGGGLENAEEDITQAACLLSLGTAAAPPGIGTALAWALSSRFPVARPLISAALLPHITARLAAARPEKAAQAAYLTGFSTTASTATGHDAEAAEQLAARIRSALETAGVPLRLRETGLNLDRMASAVEAARDLEFVAQSPWTVTIEDAFELLKAAY